MIANTEFESDGSGTNSPGPDKKRKHGLGKGGACAKYCTMSVATPMAHFPNEHEYPSISGCPLQLGTPHSSMVILRIVGFK